jgi:hypothetical protein
MVTRINRVSKNPQVPVKVKAAFEIISNDPKATLQTAAEAAGLTTVRLRRLLKLPQTRAWIAEQRRLQLDTICAANPEALRRLRDTTENAMAAVGAIKTLEAMKELVDPSVRTGVAVAAPGLIVQIVHSNGSTETIGPPPAPPLIDISPELDVREPRERP